jgi:class 3 adenylate cyclase
MRQQIEAFGGTVEKFAGDAIMAVFRVPRVNEDDAERWARLSCIAKAARTV